MVTHDDVARARQEQREGDISSGAVEHIGGIPHRNTALFSRRQIDMIAADAEIADHLKLRDAVHQSKADLNVGIDVNPVYVSQFAAPGIVVGPPAHHPALLLDHRQDRAVGLNLGHYQHSVFGHCCKSQEIG